MRSRRWADRLRVTFQLTCFLSARVDIVPVDRILVETDGPFMVRPLPSLTSRLTLSLSEKCQNGVNAFKQPIET